MQKVYTCVWDRNLCSSDIWISNRVHWLAYFWSDIKLISISSWKHFTSPRPNMKLIILIAFLALLNLAKSQNCNNDCSRIGINFLCGKTVRNGREIRCTYRNPCEMHLYACQKREGKRKNWKTDMNLHTYVHNIKIISPEWRKDTTGRCTRDSEECRR